MHIHILKATKLRRRQLLSTLKFSIMRFLKTLFKLAVVLVSLKCVSANFRIEDRYPESQGSEIIVKHYVKEDEKVALSCTSSEEFNMCRWARPGSQSPCGIFSTDDKKQCSRSGDMSRWTVEREGSKTCLVYIDEIRETEVGEWNCELQSFPNKDGQYESGQEYTIIAMVEPATVELKGAMEIVVYEGEMAEFNCQATGNPLPTTMEWTIGGAQIEGMTVASSENGFMIEQSATAKVQRNWSGRKLRCQTKQLDYEGNEVLSSDERTLRVEQTRNVSPEKTGPAQRAGEFKIIDRYPKGIYDETPDFLIAKDTTVTFSCTSSLSWHVCRWKRPNSGNPCGIFSDDHDGKSCDGAWNTVEGGESWKLRANSPTECSITGTISDMDFGEWNCELQSTPIQDEHNVYESDQQYFLLQVVQAPEIDLRLPPEVELTEGDDIEIEINVKDAYPPPEIRWFINTKEFKPELVEQSNRVENDRNQVSFSQTVRYTGKLSDTGKKLICRTYQLDTEGNVVTSEMDTFLNVKALPPPEPRTMSAGMIGGIVTVFFILLLLLIILIFLYKKRKWCFAKVYVKEKQVEKGEIEIQTDSPQHHDAGNSAAFGPDKPSRFAGYPEQAPFIDEEEDHGELKTFADDEKRAFNEEGRGSPVGSLQSLDEDATERDWKDTVRALGPKFSHFADFVRGNVEDSGVDEDDSSQRNSNSDNNVNDQSSKKHPEYKDDSEV